MNKLLFKYMSISIIIAMLICSSTQFVFAEESGDILSNEIRIINPSNDDSNFPLNTNVDISEESIRYNKNDEPLYGFEYELDGENLDFDLIFSLKENFDIFDDYKMDILNTDNDRRVFSEKTDKDSAIIVSDLSVGTTYDFSIKLTGDSVMSEYLGKFTIVVELDSSLTIDLFYQNSMTKGLVTTYTPPSNESEPNNTRNQANTIRSGISIIGSFLTNDDDYFCYTAPSGNNISLDITLSVSENMAAHIILYDSSGKYIVQLASDYSSLGFGIHYRLNNVTPGAKYYICVGKTYSESSTDKYYLTVNYSIKNAWYSQFAASVGGVDYWNPNKLDQLSITYVDKNGTIKQPVFIDGKTSGHWMTEGCCIASLAMMLRNMNKTMLGYDFRTGYKGNLMADPYTVVLANCKINGMSITSNSTSLTLSNNPILVSYYYDVASRFGATVKTFACSNETQLKELIDEYGYVAVYFNNKHFMVLTGYNTTGSTFADRFIVCDPAAKTYSAGADVLLSKTTSGYKSKGFNDITQFVVFE